MLVLTPVKGKTGVVDLIDDGAKTHRAGCDYPARRGQWREMAKAAIPHSRDVSSMAGECSDNGPAAPIRPPLSSARREERREMFWGLFLGLPLALAGLVGLPVRYRPYTIPSASMEPEYPAGSTILVSRAAYGFSRETFEWLPLPIEGRWPASPIHRGDVVVFRGPKNRAVVFIKRVVGVAGDRVQMVQDFLVLNGDVLQREPYDTAHVGIRFVEHMPGGPSYKIFNGPGLKGPYKNTVEVTVPAGHLFVLGDSRDNSTDSRMPDQMGFIPVENVVGKVVMRIDAWGQLLSKLQQRTNSKK